MDSNNHLTSISGIYRFAQQIIRLIGQNPADELAAVKESLENSVIRPLAGLLQSTDVEETSLLAVDENIDHWLWELTREATTLLISNFEKPELLEAVAALQRLTLLQPDPNLFADRSAVLKDIQKPLANRIQAETNGPYLATNLSGLYNWLGEKQVTTPQMAFCRCGGSSIKPFCDGTHAKNGFSDAKDPNRVADQRDTYTGVQITVLDNRGICQHSGLCTDRVSTVFRLGKEPFISPSGGRMDEIIRAVRDCPSGALSYAIDGIEARDQADHNNTREPKIEITRDGPYRVTGGIKLVDGNGDPVTKNEGSSYEHYALCRCGKSQNKPFCSGMHWYVGFHDPVEKDDSQPTIFEWAGGYPAFLRMTRLFYEKHVPQDELLAPLFGGMAGDHPERVAKWLAEVFCGPPDYSKEYGGYSRMLSEHINKQLTEEQRARWVKLISLSATEAMLPNDAEFKSAFGSYIEWGSRLAVENSQTDSKPPQKMPMPHWDWNTSAGPPGSRVSALVPPEPEAGIMYPAADELISFEKYIKQLFRKKDRQSMSFVFDLWKAEDVRKYSDEILRRLENGSMPCDGKWENEKLQLFIQWKEAGMPD